MCLRPSAVKFVTECDCRPRFCGIALHASVLSRVPWRRNRGRGWATYDAVDGTSNAVEHVVRAIARALKHQAPLPTSSSMTMHCTNQTQEEIWIDCTFLKQQVLYFL